VVGENKKNFMGIRGYHSKKQGIKRRKKPDPEKNGLGVRKDGYL
jgi:hypothetical protein